MSLSNQGRDTARLLDDVSYRALEAASFAARKEVQEHPPGAHCSCPAIEALAVLYEMGYRVIRSLDE